MAVKLKQFIPEIKIIPKGPLSSKEINIIDKWADELGRFEGYSDTKDECWDDENELIDEADFTDRYDNELTDEDKQLFYQIWNKCENREIKFESPDYGEAKLKGSIDTSPYGGGGKEIRFIVKVLGDDGNPVCP